MIPQPPIVDTAAIAEREARRHWLRAAHDLFGPDAFAVVGEDHQGRSIGVKLEGVWRRRYRETWAEALASFTVRS